MVKVKKQPIKPKPVVSKTNKKDAKTGQSGTQVGTKTTVCIECGTQILDSTKALQCELCDEIWKCAECIGLTDGQYEVISALSVDSLHWFCDSCDKQMFDKVICVNQPDSSLHKRLESLEQSLADTQQRLENKIDMLADTMMQKKIETFEQQLTDTQKSLEEKVDQLAEAVITKNQVPSKALIETSIADALKGKLDEDREEEEEIKNRKTNVILFGLSESNADEPADRQTEDLDQVALMMHELKLDDTRIQNVIRLGAVGGDDSKPRPLKVILENEEQRQRTLASAKNLKFLRKGDWDKVFIQPDLTPKQRAVRRILVQELKDRQAKGERNLTIVNNRIVTRRAPRAPDRTPLSTGQTVTATPTTGSN